MNDAKRITPAELEELAGRGAVTILDMRRSWDASDRKIPGAIRVEPDRYRDYTGSLPKGRTVVTYCT
jgi:rhodanese-related sulfurtransferase